MIALHHKTSENVTNIKKLRVTSYLDLSLKTKQAKCTHYESNVFVKIINVLKDGLSFPFLPFTLASSDSIIASLSRFR